MNLEIANELFVVGGATSGFGRAIAQSLVAEGAKVIVVARTASKLKAFQQEHPQHVETVVGDITRSGTLEVIMDRIGNRKIAGAVINSGGPPAKSARDATLEDWDEAYRTVFRWKVELTQKLIQKMIPQGYGRIVYVESVSIKQPVDNLVLSNSIRLAVTGYVKTLSQEIGQHGITLNILGPGYHATQRIENLLKKNSELKGVSVEDLRASFIKQLAVNDMGHPKDFASLALWLLSPLSKFVTGQVVSVDGGFILGTMG